MPSDTDNTLIETWSIHDRIHRYFLAAITVEGLCASMTPRGRSVRDLFAHIHNVRLMWLKASAPDLMAGLEKIEPGARASGETLSSALEASGAAVADLLRRGLEAGGRIKGFKPHAAAFLGYMISHESHHRGQAEWALRMCGQPVSDSVSYGLWEWGSR